MGYENGKIYKLVSPTTDKVYIGSTIRPLKDRLRLHLHKSNTSSSQFLGNVIAIGLIEEYPCTCRKELEKRERYWIENTKNTINMTIPTRTIKEWWNDKGDKQKEINRKYHHDHKEEINRRARERRNEKTRDYEKLQRAKRKPQRREYDRKRRLTKGKELNQYNRKVLHFKNSWGGDPRNHNNLLKISIDLFN